MSKKPNHAGNPFAALKQSFKSATQNAAETPQPVKNSSDLTEKGIAKPISPEPYGDNVLFAQAMAGVVQNPTGGQQRANTKKGFDATPRARQQDEQAALSASQSGKADWGDGNAVSDYYDDELSYYQPGIQKSVFNKLRRGQYAIQDELDLHRLTIAEARSALRGFLQHCHQQGLTCVRMVPGKGLHSQKKPVLRGWLVNTLRQREDVLAFTTAPNRDGGLGALYVLLKRSK